MLTVSTLSNAHLAFLRRGYGERGYAPKLAQAAAASAALQCAASGELGGLTRKVTALSF
jgi:hypothetical protein